MKTVLFSVDLISYQKEELVGILIIDNEQQNNQEDRKEEKGAGQLALLYGLERIIGRKNNGDVITTWTRQETSLLVTIKQGEYDKEERDRGREEGKGGGSRDNQERGFLL